MINSDYRIALVNPPNTAFTFRDENSTPPLGLAYIAAVLRQTGLAVDMFDLAEKSGRPSKRELAEVGLFGYDLYGFTSYTKTFTATVHIANLIKGVRPEAFVVIGGPHVSPCAADVLRTATCFDAVIRNEGEFAMLQLAKELRSGNANLSKVEGLVYRTTRGGKDQEIVDNGPPSIIADLDGLPHPARDYKYSPGRRVYESRRHASPVRVEFLCSSRGCPKRCSFCSIVVMSPKYRVRSVKSLFAELEELYEQEPFGHISFLDPNFLVHTRRSLEFAEQLYAWNKDITWSGTATADTIATHESVLKRLGVLNCAFLEVGIESGSPAALRRFNKGTTVEQNLAAVRMLNNAGIGLELDFVMFDPEVTLNDLKANCEFLRQADLLDHFPIDHLHNTLKIYPGTPARSHYIQKFALQDSPAMPVVTFFCNHDAELVYLGMKAFISKYHDRFNDAVIQGDRCLRQSIQQKRNVQDGFSNLIRLRHSPFKLFESLVELVASRAISNENDLQRIGNTGAFAIFVKSLEEVERYVKKANTEIIQADSA